MSSKTIVVCVALVGCAFPLVPDEPEPGACGAQPADAEVIPLEEAKLNIEHNATDLDTGFQGFVDSEGWSCLEMTDPYGSVVLTLLGGGALGDLGLTELFFESVEPENADIPIADVLETLPEGDYTIQGPAIEAGEQMGWTVGTALLTHDIPAGPALLAPADEVEVPAGDVLFDWDPVSETIDGDPITILGYQLNVELDTDVDPNAITKPDLTMNLPATTTEMLVSGGFFQPGMPYDWEVLAIEESGNQTLSGRTFHTAP